jgi:hypothetical protein
MSPNAVKLLIDLWSRHNGQNNGEIAYAVRDAEGIGLSKNQASRAFDELVERGSLKIWRASTFTLKTKEARTWELTAEPAAGRAATKDFMRWSAQSQQRDRDGGGKSRTQSHQRDAQSHQWDHEAPNLRNEGQSVPPAGPSRPKSPLSRSHQRDTSYIPGSVEPAAACEDGLGPDSQSRRIRRTSSARQGPQGDPLADEQACRSNDPAGSPAQRLAP